MNLPDALPHPLTSGGFLLNPVTFKAFSVSAPGYAERTMERTAHGY